MEIKIDKHTVERSEERGTNEKEIKDTIKNGKEVPAKNGKQAKEQVFTYNNVWNGKFFPEKLVRVIYVVGETIITTVTVIVQFGKWTKSE